MATQTKTKDRRKLLQAVDMLRVLSHPLRLSILCDLIERGEMSAGEIVDAQAGRYSQSQVSQYLGMLREMDLVETDRDGQVIRYRISSPEARRIIETLYGVYCGG